MRPGIPSAALSPSMQTAHLRRESSQSIHSDAGGPNTGPNAGRGGYGLQGGRGRGYNPQYTQGMPHSPNPSFRGPVPNAPRGGQNMTQPFTPQSGGLRTPQFQHSPHQAVRSPSFTNVQPMQGQMPMTSPGIPQTPYGAYQQQMGPPQVNPPFSYAYDTHPRKKGGKFGRDRGESGKRHNEWNDMRNSLSRGSHDTQRYPQQFPIVHGNFPRFDLSPASGNFEHFLTARQQAQYLSYDAGYNYYNAQAYGMNPQMQNYMPPGSSAQRFQHPQAQQQQYTPGQYNPTSMSRTSSAISDRPGSTVQQPQTPMTPTVNPHIPANRGAPSPAPGASNFKIPVRKGGIVIKDPNSGAVKTFDKQPASPAPVPPTSKSPAINSQSSSPAPPTPKAPETPRTDAKAKTADEKANEMRAAVARKIKEDEEQEEKAKKEAEEAAKAKEEPAGKPAEVEAPKVVEKAEEKKAAEPMPVKETPKVVEPVDDGIPEFKTKEEEDAYWDKIEKEEAEKEAKAEAEYQERKKREREEAARKAEREAEAAEEARLKKLEEKGNDEVDKEERMNMFRSLGKKDVAVAPAAAVAPDVDTPGDSGAETPKSDASMPPPKAALGNKQKPAALKLKTSEPVEAPQPSAALQSLRSARFLTHINDVKYPESIASPNPALNSGALMGKFRYDKTFLLQFQPVFVEKPSETWSDKVKETVGDTSDTPRTAGPRGAGNMSARSGSARGSILSGSSAFQSTGGFGAFTSQARTLPPGTTSNDRYNASLKGPGGARPGGFPVGQFGAQPMSRNVSATSFGGSHPQSPRNNPSQRNTSNRNKGGKRESDKDAKAMPLTAGLDLKPIEVSATGWKPRSIGAAAMAGPPPGGDGYLAPDVVQRKVKAALNKMTPSTFDKISAQILDIVAQSKKETDGRTLRQVIQLTFEKATDEAHWAQMYAEWCGRMLAYMTPEIRDETISKDKHGNIPSGSTLFRKYLLNRCQEDFEAGWKSKIPDKPAEGGESAEAVMLSDEYYIAAAAKRRGLGLVRFIGELFKLGMLTSRIMIMCVQRLLEYDGQPDEAEVESLTSLLKTIGENLDSEEKLRPSMDAYFNRIGEMIKIPGLPSRLQFMLMVCLCFNSCD
jgi:translation initiation factor 4G